MLDASNPVWPGNTGEIDIFETVNGMGYNSMTLHTGSGCSVVNETGSIDESGNVSFTGTLQTAVCDVDAAGQAPNAGCSITAPHRAIVNGNGSTGDMAKNTAGAAFNANGGGVFALEWTSEYLSVYFFPRGQIPASLQAHSTTSVNATSSAANFTRPAPAAQAPTPSLWPATHRQAHFSGCDFDQHLAKLSLVIDTDFCGGWAESTWASSGCKASTGVETCQGFVGGGLQCGNGKGKGNGGEEAYWVIRAMSVWQME